MKTKFSILLTLFTFLTFQISFAQSNSGRMVGKGAGTGALIGAIAGAVFGDPYDVLGSAAEGALIGGGIGAISGAIEGGKMDRQTKEEYEALIREFGEDNLRGYVALMQCDHERSIALFKVGEVSSNLNHGLAGLWLQAIAEKDRRNVNEAEALYARIVDTDRDIDDLQQAGLAVDNYVLILRDDRRANNLPSCP